MNRNKTLNIVGTLGLAAVLGMFAQPVTRGAWKPPQEIAQPRTIDLAICLDTSGSMSGLINAAKQKLWAIVNELAVAQPTPRLRVALLTFGNNGHDPEDGWVRMDSPLTDDLDFISQKLFALSTNGGEEYVGRVLQYADQLDWNPSDDALKLVVVAGNESADQDREVPFRDMCRALISKGVMINSIYCGPAADNIAPGWQEVARLADGQFATIDQDQGTVIVETPFDEELSTLSSAVNATYVPFGTDGRRGLANQAAQDANASGLNSSAAAARALTKGQAIYHCSWDLVDACRAGQIKLEEVEAGDLPEAMRGMTVAERSAYIETMGRKRALIQEEINALSQKRDEFVGAEMKRRALDDTQSLDHAIRQMVRAQAVSKGFRFEEAAGYDQ